MNQSNLSTDISIDDNEDKIVISGIAGRFPKSNNIKELHVNLLNKMELGSNNHKRWHNRYNMPHRTGEIDNIEKFDQEFFDTSAIEANILDGMVRMLLEHTYEAIIDAGINPKELRGTRTAVFTTISNDTQFYFVWKPEFISLPVSCNRSYVANKISYWLGTTGPSYNIDSACSTSSCAVINAYNMIRTGDCDSAIVCASNLCVHPFINLGFYRLGVLSSDGYCKPFDETSEGYMRSDAITVIYIQKAKNARRIYATIVHGKINNDGFNEEGITFPSVEMQKTLLEEVYEECKISPCELSYLEAHGTGTSVGDPVEIMAVDQALCSKRNTPLLTGSIKSNLGHSEPTCGLSQIAKVILSMETGIIAPTIHFKHPRENLSAIIEGRIKIVTEPTKFEGNFVGINSYGFGGTNTHILLKSNPKQKINNGIPVDDLPRLVIVSGRTEEAVRVILDDVQNRAVDAEYISLLHHIYSDNVEYHFYRGYMITGSKKSYNVINKVEHCSYVKRPVCFIFSGLGSQWFGISRNLMKFSVFANAIENCDIILRYYNISLTDILTSENQDVFDNIINLLVALVGLQIGVVDLLTSIGIVPDFIIGHSIGELICGYADGCLTAEETILSAYFIGLALHESNIINGSMAEINSDLGIMKNICPSDIDITCYNSSSNFIMSGPTDSIRAFLAKLQADNVVVNEISCGYIPFHSRYIEPAVAKCEEYLNRILPQKKFRSSRWLTTSAHEYSNILLPLCSKYYTNHLLSSVLFAKTMRSIPKNAVTIEISPQNILQRILKNSLCSTVTNVALYKRTEDHSAEIFLETIGKLYNAGLQPQIANLYPTVKFPVSRGTQMISPLIRWNHSEDFYIYNFNNDIDIYKEMLLNVDVYDEQFEYLTGHVVNDKNLFPAMGYLFHLWKMIASMKKQDNVPIVFENVNFIRATVLQSPRNEVKLNFSIHQGTNRFEITEGDNAVVTGKIRIPINIDNEKKSVNLAEHVNDEEEMNTKDIYKELRLRGYKYTGVFRGLNSASVMGSNGHIAWKSNWVAFMDNMLQMKILSQNSRSLFVPTKIRKIIIDPKYHLQIIKDYPINEGQISVRHYKSLDAIISGGIEIYGMVAAPISRRYKSVNTVLEEYKFVAHRDLGTMSLQDAIRMSLHLALEYHNTINVKILEFVDENDKVTIEDLNYPFVNEILSDLPQIRHHIKLATISQRFESISPLPNVSITEIKRLSRDEKYLMVIGFNILTKNNNKLYQQLISLLMPQGFLLTLEQSDVMNDYSCLKAYDLNVILEKQINNRKTLLLLRKNVTEKQYQIVHVNNYDFSWVDELKLIMKMSNKSSGDSRIILVAKDFECGLLGLVNCLRREPGGEIIRSVFIQDDKAPAFSLQEPLYTKQLQLDLPINVIRSGNVWGSYRHFPLPSLEPKLVQNAFVTQTVHGDLSALCWIQDKTFCNEFENLVNVIYSPLNFKDIMLTTGRITAESIGLFASEYRTPANSFGLEFVGFDMRGRRLMGLSTNGMTNTCMADKHLSWVVPDKWTMEDAATIPVVYMTCYCALYTKGKMKKGDKVLIHSGSGGVGQAAIHLALYEGCEVYTTVGTVEKRQFIKEMFPSIPEDNIGNSRDTSFEQMIMRRTKGRGVDIVLNSLAEEKLQASVRCLANGGRFLEIGKFDMISNNPLDLSIFSKGISFYGILLDKIKLSSTEQKIILSKQISEGLANGAIKPLCRKVFERNEIEAAFRYMAAGKHIGKIIIRVRKEEEPLDAPLLAYPRYYCFEHKCYIILGGLGGFGLELADWLTLRGAKNLVLTSRNGIKTGYQQSRVKLWQSYGVDVQIIKVDDNLKHEDCESILKFAERRAPVDAIFNLAVVLKDCIFENQSSQTFEDLFRSKALLTKKMDELSRTICPQLRHFVVFSSLSCGRGNAGQTNYGMANSVMERICEKRMEEGLHGLAIQWGAIGDVGLVADMQEEDKELVIGGTLQQRISSCLNTLEIFLLQDRPIISSMVVAEKAEIGGSMKIYEIIARIMELKDINAVPQYVPLAEMGMDSMMAIEIKQTLERELDISLTAQDIRTLNFAKLRQMTTEEGEIYNTNKIDASNLESWDIFIRKIKNSDFVPDILVELVAKKEVDRGEIFLVPGIEGCSSVYKTIVSGIKSSATCLQHGVLNIPDDSHSVMKSASYLLPHILKKMKDQREFLIVGYSFGSLIAIELARLLEANNFLGRLILIDGAPDQIKFLVTQLYSSYTSPEELQNIIILNLLIMYTTIDKTKLALELNECNTVDEKLKILHTYFPKDLSLLTMDNQKLVYFTIYNHIIAIQNYNISTLPRLKSSITLIKPTFQVVTFTEENYGLHKVTEGKVQVYSVEGDHITIMDNDNIISLINEEWKRIDDRK